jgi:PPIC-type PPIASE domain
MNKFSPAPPLACLLAVALTSCASVRDGIEGQKDAVARVDGYTLTIEHAAELLSIADESIAPPHPSIVDRLADLWIGYTLLASELTSPDTFSSVDVTPLIGFEMDQELVWSLREDVILTRVEPSESALLESFQQEQPYTSVELQQILIRVPDAASEAQVDSLRLFAEELRERVVAGEDFGQLARTYSDDPSSASQGGKLGWVGRDRLVPELDAIVFHMEPGTVSEAVRSSFGYHIVTVTDRQEPDFEEVREDYRQAVMERYIGGSERVYIDSLFDAADFQFTHGAVDLVRQLVYDARLERLGPAERSAVLARYRGGELTLGEWADFVIRRSPNARRAFSADSAAVAGYLRELVRNMLLIKAARDLGYTLPESKADSVRSVGTREVFSAAAVSGLRRRRLVNGEETVEQAVDRVLAEVFSQQRSPAPLERVAPALKIGHVYQIYPERFPEVIELLVAIRAGEAPPATPATEPGS